jgi:hypothetical protein
MFETQINGKKFASYRSRGAMAYKVALFPEAPTGIALADFAFRLLRSKELEKVHGPFMYLKNGEQNTPRAVSGREIANKLGGQNSFFTAGHRVLDIGAGAGVAVAELKTLHPEVDFVALEKGYHKNIEPAYPELGQYVGADWNKMPFADNSFSRILSVESFPKHAEWIWDYKSTFSDITRISKEGTIWRGTHLGPDFNQPVLQSDWVGEMAERMTQNGWDLYVSNRIFIAQLVSKPVSNA